jgi:TDG/mug DNA glycosylase family protein
MAATVTARPARPVLPDVLRTGLDIVFCGTAAGAASARRGAYYAGPGNAFWPTLFRVGLTPRQLAPEEFRTVVRCGLGLTDMAKAVSGNDHELPTGSFDAGRLERAVRRYRPAILAFTSKRAAAEYFGCPVAYGPQPMGIGATAVFVLPSPSGAARAHWDESWWQELARLKTRRRQPAAKTRGRPAPAVHLRPIR